MTTTFWHFKLRAGVDKDTVEVVDTRNNRVAFLLEYAEIDDIEAKRDYGEVIIEMRVRGRLGLMRQESDK